MHVTRPLLAALLLAAMAPTQSREVGGVIAAASEQAESPMTVYALSEDGRWVLQYTEKHLLCIDPVAQLFSLQPNDRDAALGLHRLELTAPVLSPDGSRFACRRGNNHVEVRKSDRAELVSSHRDVPAGPMVLRDDVLLVGAADGKLHLRDVDNGEAIAAYEVHDQPITYLAYRQRGSGKKTQMLFVTGAEDRRVLVHDFVSRKQVAELEPDHVPRLVAFDDAVAVLVTASKQNLQVWDLARGRKKKTIKLTSKPTAVALSPDGKRYLVGCADGTVRYGLAKSSKPKASWTAHAAHKVLAVAFVMDGKQELAVTAGDRHDVCYWKEDQLQKEFGGSKAKQRRKR